MRMPGPFIGNQPGMSTGTAPKVPVPSHFRQFTHSEPATRLWHPKSRTNKWLSGRTHARCFAPSPPSQPVLSGSLRQQLEGPDSRCPVGRTKACLVTEIRNFELVISSRGRKKEKKDLYTVLPGHLVPGEYIRCQCTSRELSLRFKLEAAG